MDFDERFLFKVCCSKMFPHFSFPHSYNNNSKMYNAHTPLIWKEPEI